MSPDPRRALRAVATALVLFATACGAGSGAADARFDGAPLIEATSPSGALRVAVRASPSPPVRGVCSFELTITDAAGAPVDGLSVTVVPWMEAHAHGTSVTPTVLALGAGVYRVDEVSLYMAGTWVLRTTLARPDGGAREELAIAIVVR